MKLTKGMKKALSLLLSGALVVTGVNVGSVNVKAAEPGENDVETEIEKVTVNFTVDEIELDGESDVELTYGITDTAGWSTTQSGTVSVSEQTDYTVDVEGFKSGTTALRNLGYFALVDESEDNNQSVELTINSYTINDTYEVALSTPDSGLVAAPEKNPAYVDAQTTPGVDEYIQNHVGNVNIWGDPAVIGEGDDVVLDGEDAYFFFSTTKPEQGSFIFYVKGEPATEETEEPSTETKEPGTETEEPSTETKAPGTETEAPGTETEAPGTETKAPGTETKAPSTETEAPAKKNIQGDNKATDKPQGNMDQFSVFGNYTTDESSWDTENNINEIVVDKNGEYEISFYNEKRDTSDLAFLYLSTNLFGDLDEDGIAIVEPDANGKDKAKASSIADDFEMKATTVVIGEGATAKTYDVTGKSYLIWANKKPQDGLRLTLKGYGAEPTNYFETPDLKFSAFGEGTAVPVALGEKITVKFTVNGMNKSDADSTQAPDATVAPTATAGGVATGASSSAITGSLKVAKKNQSIIIAQKKSKTVKFTVTAAEPATQAAAVVATIKNKKIVESATVDGDKVKIQAAKKATKGASTTVTLKSTNPDGTVKSAKIKVTIQNKAKKIKAKKKSVTIKKKGKTAKVVLKVTKAENNKKAVADTIKVKANKVAKLSKYSAKKGQITVVLKGKKKGKGKVTIQVGSKKVKVNVTVKK